MKKRIAILAVLVLAGGYLVFGLRARAGRAPRIEPSRGWIRGAWHVHTTRSDGRGTLDEVVRAAREAGLQYVVVSDHNVLSPGEEGYRDGVLVVQATEASTRYGHVVAVGVSRALSPDELDDGPLQAIAALGGQAVIAHPLHPRRPFSGWGTGPWKGFEVVSNDSSWHSLLRRRDFGRAAVAAAYLPWDRARTVVEIFGDLRPERARFDEELRAARSPGGPRPAKVLLCSADAHGYPSYAAAFEAFSMHVPITLSGDAVADARGIAAALLDGRAVCVFDGVAPVASASLARDPAGRDFVLSLEAPDLRRAELTLLRDGAPVATASAGGGKGSGAVRLPCGEGGCPPGDYRVEGRWDGRPWIFTNPVTIE